MKISEFASIFLHSAKLDPPQPAQIDPSKFARMSLSEAIAEGKILYPIKAILFDVYGTLFSSALGDIGLSQGSSTLTKELSELMQEYSILLDPISLQKLLAQSIRAEHDRARSSGIDYPEVDIREIWRTIDALNHIESIDLFACKYEAVLNPLVPMPNIEVILPSKSLPLGIISNAQFYTPHLFEAYFKTSLLQLGFKEELLLWSYEHRRAKPSLALYKIMVERLQQFSILPNEALYIGNDMLNDVWSAKQLGFQTVIFTGDRRSFRPRSTHQLVQGLIADYYLENLKELKNCMDTFKNLG